MLIDFILEFRFEYIWPAWLLMQSVYETFKYQGLVSCDVGFNSKSKWCLAHNCADIFILFTRNCSGGL